MLTQTLQNWLCRRHSYQFEKWSLSISYHLPLATFRAPRKCCFRLMMSRHLWIFKILDLLWLFFYAKLAMHFWIRPVQSLRRCLHRITKTCTKDSSLSKFFDAQLPLLWTHGSPDDRHRPNQYFWIPHSIWLTHLSLWT